MAYLKLMKTKIKIFALCIPALIMIASPLHAQNLNPAIDILPAKSLSSDSLYVNADSATHPPIRMTPDKSELIRLDSDAGSIIIGNPAHLSIMADSARTLILVPQTPGATHFTVLNHKGEILMQRHVIVASPKEKYIRIRRSCATSSNKGCQPTRVYYCPDMCHEIAVATEASETGGDLEGAASSNAANQINENIQDEGGEE